MSASGKPLVVALEEHYWDPALLTLFPGGDGKRVANVEKRLLDMGELRLREMDESPDARRLGTLGPYGMVGALQDVIKMRG